MRKQAIQWAGVVAGSVVATVLAGCMESKPSTASAPAARPMQENAGLLQPKRPVNSGPAFGQTTFASADEGVKALLDAVDQPTHDGLKPLFGPEFKQLVSGDPVSDANDYKAFAAAAKDKLNLEQQDDHTDVLHIGASDWPFAIPLAKASDGKWYFNTSAGVTEILARRIGANELQAISTARSYVDAQREYASVDRDGDGVLQYAQHFRSKPGMKDGLYWETQGDEAPSPFGELVAAATNEGYFSKDKQGQGPQPFHGYYFRILKQQGPAAPGGKYSYIINNNMIAGFALVAWPDKYGKSGIMTFIVNHAGKVYQKDLGKDSASVAKGMTTYNPDSTWTLVKD